MPFSLLIVDDHPAIRQVLTRILTSEGYRVREAATGEDALTSWQVNHPDAILLDLNLPDISGWEVCRHIKARATTPIMLMTGDTTRARSLRRHGSTVDGVFLKPFALAEVLAELATILAPPPQACSALDAQQRHRRLSGSSCMRTCG